MVELASKHQFESMYERTPPWDIGRPQADLQAAFDRLTLPGPVLDLGCGTGEHVLELARRGVKAWGLDSTEAAIEAARRKAEKRDLPNARFVLGDALALEAYQDRFGTVMDCGLWHVIHDHERYTYIEQLTAIMAPGGWHLMLGFDTNRTGFGPRGYSREELLAAFTEGWREVFIREATYEINDAPGPDGKAPPRTAEGRPGIPAWLSLFERI